MARTRVLVVEDSATVRAVLCEVLASDPEIELVGVASDGRQAIEMCEAKRPDVITMDIMLPVMSGLAATEHIMAYCPTPILVVSSSFNRGELFKMYDVLAAGAVDVLEKPTGNEPAGDWERRFLGTVKLVSRIRVITHLRARSRALGRPAPPPLTPPLGGDTAFRVAALGASTGGPGAIVDVLRSLPTDLEIPVLFVLHINPQFGSAFADWLGTQTPWPTRFPRDGEPLAEAVGSVIIAVPDRHMLIRNGRIRVDDGPERFSCRPSVDVLFESVAAECGRSAIAALLTGMGRDGAAGLLAMRTAGGRTVAQDEATSVVYGMPREAWLNGGAEVILPLNEIGPTLAAAIRSRKDATMSVLIVDDSLTVRMDLVEAFEAAGMRAVPAATLAAARQALVRDEPRLIVLDVLLPDGDGVEFLRELRADPRLAALPVLLLSSEAEVKDRIRGLAMGANEYVGKPYDTGYLVVRARELLGSVEHSGGGFTVLVIDDSLTFRQSLSDELADAGYTVLVADSGRAGLAAIAAHRPDAVIVDGVMPDMDGTTLIRRVRLDAATRSLPCLLLTASQDGAAQLRALEAGADAFVRKDGDTEVILARLAAMLRSVDGTPLGRIASLSSPRKILAVDDSATYLNEIDEVLRAEGYEVSLAHSGEEALELLAVQPVDCILMDVVMPGMGGREACARIKAAAGVRDIPVILVTGYDNRETMLDGLGAGADDYISKSSEFEVLCARVLAQIRRKQFEDENRRYREELVGRELEAAEQQAARSLAEQRAAMVDELERKVAERTRELEATVVERRHAERMASVGMLSASIAHEINNPLAIVVANLELLKLGLGELADEPALKALLDGPAHGLARELLERLGSAEDPLNDALEAAGRVREIVRDLRIFARSDAEDVPTPVDLRKVLESSLRMASNEIRHRARLTRDYAELPPVVANESRLGQVFLNLIVNAAQAMPLGRAGDNEIRITTMTAGPGDVAVEIADTGVGIPADKLARVFDPFFTTKPAGVGTGLGLAICHRIVSEIGGSITARSVVGEGTTFRVVLHATAGGDAPKLAAPAPAGTVPNARGARVLVVDDEPALCKTIERILGRDHAVTAVTAAGDALALIRAGERFDVILSDLMMPEQTGMELHATLAGSVPDQARRMIFMSGGALTPDAVRFFRDQPNPSIDKPFAPAALRRLVAETLERLDPKPPDGARLSH